MPFVLDRIWSQCDLKRLLSPISIMVKIVSRVKKLNLDSRTLFLCLMTFFVECPYSTYKDFTGYAKSCIACPANSRHSRTGSTRRADCHCIEGYEGNPAGYVECKSKHNPI